MLGQHQQQGGLPFTPFRGGRYSPHYPFQRKVSALPFTPFRKHRQDSRFQPKVSALPFKPFRRQKGGGRVGVGGVVKPLLTKMGKKALFTGLTMLPPLLAELSQRKKPVLSTLKHHGKKALTQLLGSTAQMVKQDVLGMKPLKKKRKAAPARLSFSHTKKRRTLAKKKRM